MTLRSPIEHITRRQALKFIGGTTLTFLNPLLYAFLAEPEFLRINHLCLRFDNLPYEFDGYRIAHLSDIHMDSWMTPARFEKIVNLTIGIQPDLVVISGDFLTHHPEMYTPHLSRLLKRISNSSPVLAVLGNHDHWTDANQVRLMLASANVHELNNTWTTISKGSDRIIIAGVDDVWEEKDRLDIVLDDLPDRVFTILLAHEPDFADISASTGRFSLQLSGHSHGGQVVIPLLGPPLTPPFAKKYPLGLYRIQKMQLYTTSGLGMVRPYVRFNCPPEISLLTLTRTYAG